MPDEQRNPIQEYQVTTWFFFLELYSWNFIFRSTWMIHGITSIYSLTCSFMLLIFPLLYATGCSHSWGPFLWCRWNSRSNYKCELISVLFVLFFLTFCIYSFILKLFLYKILVYISNMWSPTHIHWYQLPHMLPSEEAFAAAVSALGIENKDDLVVYDGKGIFSAARVWW